MREGEGGEVEEMGYVGGGVGVDEGDRGGVERWLKGEGVGGGYDEYGEEGGEVVEGVDDLGEGKGVLGGEVVGGGVGGVVEMVDGE